MSKKKKLTKDDINLSRKFLRYKADPIAFIEECVQLPTVNDDKKFKLFDPQKSAIKDFFNHHYLIFLKSRQIGISTLTQAIITYICTFYSNCKIGILSKDGKEATNFCRKVQNMIDTLPEWIKPKYSNKSIQYFVLENGCQLHTATVSPQDPNKVFRGETLTLLVVDEAAFINKIDQAWTGMYPSLSRAHTDAEKANIPYGTIIISTPNKMEGTGKWYYDMWRGAENNESRYKAIRIKWDQIPDYKNDPNWYRNQCEGMNWDRNRIAQELDLKFVGAEGALFDESIQIQLQNCGLTEPDKIATPKNKGDIHVFKKPNRRNYHIIGVDCASAYGADKSAIEVIEYETMEQVMEYQGKLPNIELVDIIKIICLHVPNNIIVVENNGGYGDVVLTSLTEDEDIEFNLFGEYRKVNGRDEHVPGLNTNPRSRKLILDALFEIVKHDPHVIKSKRLASELLGLTNKKSRIEADKGFHDDLAMAFGFCAYVRQYCTDFIGDVQPLGDDEISDNQIISRGAGVQLALKLNNGNGAFLKYARSDFAERPEGEFKEEVDKFVNNQLMNPNFKGLIDLTRWWDDTSNELSKRL